MPKPTQQERDQVIAQVVSTLYHAQAHTWPVQDKGVLIAAVKLQITELPERNQEQRSN